MNRKVLIIVEGERAEPKLFNALFSNFNINYDIVYLRTNVYKLYLKMKEYDFNCDVKEALKEILSKKREAIDSLNDNFAFTYLIFDGDLHHCEEEDKGKSNEERVRINLFKLEQMVSYFTNETDPTIGKMFVNYPMFESYRDCDSFFDENFKYNEVDISKIDKYKSIVSQKKMAGRRVEDFDLDDFTSLIKMNIFKLNYINKKIWNVMPYNEFIEYSVPKSVFDKEKDYIDNYSKISVINTSLLLVVDYFGARDNFYEKLMNS